MNDKDKSIAVNFIPFYLYQRRGRECRLKDVLLHKIILNYLYINIINKAVAYSCTFSLFGSSVG